MNKKKVGIIIAITVIAIIFLIIFFKGEEIITHKVNHIKIGTLNGASSISILQMIERKEELMETIQTEYEINNSANDIIAKLQKEEYDFAILPTNLAITLYNQTQEYKIIGISTTSNMYIIANTKNCTIQNINDLNQKEIHTMPEGSILDTVLKYILQKNNLQQDVKINNTMNISEITNAIIAGNIDIALLPEPFITQALSKNTNLKIVLDIEKEWSKISPKVKTIPQNCVIAKKNITEKHPEIIQDFINRMQESINWITQNPAVAGQIATNYKLGLNRNTAEQAIPRSKIEFVNIKEAKQNIQKYIQILYDFSPSTIGGKTPEEEFYYKQKE